VSTHTAMGKQICFDLFFCWITLCQLLMSCIV
jgi:hypothetical protein